MNARCLAVPLFVYGTMAIVARDVLWTVTQYGSDISGHDVYRSQAWETATAVSGYICVSFAVFCLVI